MTVPKFSALFRLLAVLVIFSASILPTIALAQPQQVTLAGVAYSGDALSIAQRFPYSRRYEAALKAVNDSAYSRVVALTTQTPPVQFTLSREPISELKGRDQALVVSLVLNSETVSIEQFGSLRKLVVIIRGQALFFDFKTMKVVRSYPLSFAYLDTFDRQPSEQEILERVRQVYEGTPAKPGIYGRFANALSSAELPSVSSRYLQVTHVSLASDVLAAMPPYLKGTDAVAQTWAADLVSEALSGRVGVPIVPFSKGYAIGNVMSMQVSDGSVFTLNLPKPDYEISVELTGVKKIKYGQTGAGSSFIYGAYASVKIEEPGSGNVYLNSGFKNGEVKVVPMTQTYVDDFPAYYDSINALFSKLADALNAKGNTWAKTASAAPDIESQILKTSELMTQCK